MKLIKINPDHYLVVDNSEIKEGDWFYNPATKEVLYASKDMLSWNNDTSQEHKGWKKITHSTQPIEANSLHRKYDFININPISLSEVKDLIGEVGIWQKFKEIDGSCQKGEYEHWLFESGYNQALEDNKEKKYTEEDLKYMFECGRNYQNNAEITFRVSMEYLQQSKTEWEVEFIDGKLKLK